MNANILNWTHGCTDDKACVLGVDDSQNVINKVYLLTRHIMLRNSINAVVNPAAPYKKLFPNRLANVNV